MKRSDKVKTLASATAAAQRPKKVETINTALCFSKFVSPAKHLNLE
jgi:hypothetical protein